MHKILIVEDDISLRELYKYLFLELGYSTETAENGRKALEKLSTAIPDCMLLDITMPEMDGIEFIQRLQKFPLAPRAKDVPFIVMTGESHLDATIKTAFKRNSSCRAIVPKMSNPNNVAKMVQKILNTHARK